MSATVEFTGAIDPKSIARRHGAGLALGRGARARDRRAASRSQPTARSCTIDPPRDRLAARRSLRRARARRQQGRRRAGRRARRVRRRVLLPAPDRSARHAGARARIPRRRRTTSAWRTRTASRASARTSRRAFDYFEAHGCRASDVAALWAFTVTTHTELAMDQPSQRIPLPIDLIIDPATGHVDRAHRAVGQRRSRPRPRAGSRSSTASRLSGSQLFEFTAPMNPTTITETTVQLYQLDGRRRRSMPATVELLADKTHLVVTPKSGRLPEKTRVRARRRATRCATPPVSRPC